MDEDVVSENTIYFDSLRGNLYFPSNKTQPDGSFVSMPVSCVSAVVLRATGLSVKVPNQKQLSYLARSYKVASREEVKMFLADEKIGYDISPYRFEALSACSPQELAKAAEDIYGSSSSDSDAGKFSFITGLTSESFTERNAVDPFSSTSLSLRKGDVKFMISEVDVKRSKSATQSAFEILRMTGAAEKAEEKEDAWVIKTTNEHVEKVIGSHIKMITEYENSIKKKGASYFTAVQRLWDATKHKELIDLPLGDQILSSSLYSLFFITSPYATFLSIFLDGAFGRDHVHPLLEFTQSDFREEASHFYDKEKFNLLSLDDRSKNALTGVFRKIPFSSYRFRHMQLLIALVPGTITWDDEEFVEPQPVETLISTVGNGFTKDQAIQNMIRGEQQKRNNQPQGKHGIIRVVREGIDTMVELLYNSGLAGTHRNDSIRFDFIRRKAIYCLPPNTAYLNPSPSKKKGELEREWQAELDKSSAKAENVRVTKRGDVWVSDTLMGRVKSEEPLLMKDKIMLENKTLKTLLSSVILAFNSPSYKNNENLYRKNGIQTAVKLTEVYRTAQRKKSLYE